MYSRRLLHFAQNLTRRDYMDTRNYIYAQYKNSFLCWVFILNNIGFRSKGLRFCLKWHKDISLLARKRMWMEAITNHWFTIIWTCDIILSHGKLHFQPPGGQDALFFHPHFCEHSFPKFVSGILSNLLYTDIYLSFECIGVVFFPILAASWPGLFLEL